MGNRIGDAAGVFPASSCPLQSDLLYFLMLYGSHGHAIFEILFLLNRDLVMSLNLYVP